MRIRRAQLLCAILIFCAASSFRPVSKAESRLPAFGKDTVLVWKTSNLEYKAEFVVRVAEFSPDRFVEWEDENTQGTILMPNRDLVSARGYVNSNLFNSGVDSRAKDVTTLWISQQIYRDLKAKKKVKCNLDGVQGLMVYEGDGELQVEVNKSLMTLPVIRVSDDRGGERWFLDQEDNPLLLKHTVRNFSQVLTSITTNRANTLRWIKGRKLENLPH